MTAGHSFPSDGRLAKQPPRWPSARNMQPALADPGLGAASTVEIDRVVGTETKHHTSEIGESHASRPSLLSSVDGHDEHPADRRPTGILALGRHADRRPRIVVEDVGSSWVKPRCNVRPVPHE